MAIELDIYTGKLEYKEILFDFMFDGTELRLIPPIGKEREINHWFMKSIGDGVYVNGDPLYIEEKFLKAKINETGQTIVFFPSYTQVGCWNSVLRVSIDFYMLNKAECSAVDRIGFTSQEIDYIYSTLIALYYPERKEDGSISIKTAEASALFTEKQRFLVDDKEVYVSFGISRTIRVRENEPPLELHSIMFFEFEDTTDYSFLIRLWRIAKSFIQYLCYRKNIQSFKTEVAAPYNDTESHIVVASLNVVESIEDAEPELLNKGRYIKQQYISGFEGKILSDIANGMIYQRHIPRSYSQGQCIDASRFVMITAAFEWEFNRCYPEGIPKKQSTIDAENDVIDVIENLIQNNTGKKKDIYKFLKNLVRSSSLESKITQIGKDYSEVIDVFGNRLYSLNDEFLKYSEMGARISKQRNNFAHGNLDKEFIGVSLLDLIYLEFIIYAIQLKHYGISDNNIRHIINELFGQNIGLDYT